MRMGSWKSVVEQKKTAPFARSEIGKFASGEDGSMTINALFLFITILAITGLGVDLMRFERNRSILQYTVDRAVLAAADLDQTIPPQQVVEAYLDKAGLGEYLTGVDVQESIGYRKVTATAEMEVPTHFVNFTGVRSFSAPAASAAEESIGGVEISLVLDVSGSMNSNNRLPRLKVAAKEFVDQMIENSEDGKLSISIIPYASQVSVPDSIFDQLNVSTEHDYSNCVNFTSSQFSSRTLSPTDPLTRTMHFDPWYNYDARINASPDILGEGTSSGSSLPVCEARESREILPLQKDATVLKNYIEGFIARGNTSLEIGMKWGTALLDPSMRPVVSQLAANNEIPSVFGDRPGAYGTSETLKVIVLMTDGANTTQYYIPEGYRGDNSTVWWNEQAKRYSTFDENNNRYYWDNATSELDALSNWQDHAYGNGTYERCISTNQWGNCTDTRETEETGTATELSFGELWAYTSILSNYYTNFQPWMGSAANYPWYYDIRKGIDAGVKNSRTQSICSAAKDAGVIVYTIGFEAPSGGVYQLQNCASSDSHYYETEPGVSISDVFASIASSIRKLRLTQ